MYIVYNVIEIWIKKKILKKLKFLPEQHLTYSLSVYGVYSKQ